MWYWSLIFNVQQKLNDNRNLHDSFSGWAPSVSSTKFSAFAPAFLVLTEAHIRHLPPRLQLSESVFHSRYVALSVFGCFSNLVESKSVRLFFLSIRHKNIHRTSCEQLTRLYRVRDLPLPHCFSTWNIVHTISKIQDYLSLRSERTRRPRS